LKVHQDLVQNLHAVETYRQKYGVI
jgi:hypothetical protein